jgi:putative CocE/NonD family hydrolase
MSRAARWAKSLLCLVLAAAPAWALAQNLEFRAPGSPSDPGAPAVMRDLAERLLPVYQESDPDRYLANLSALQMVAGDYGAADVSRQSLRDRRRQADSGRPVGRGAIYDLYAHAKAMEADDRIPFAEAFAKAYQDLVPRLSDHDAYAVTGWLEISPQTARENLQKLLDEQRSKDTINQPDAVNLIWAYLGFDAYRAFAPLVGSLDSEGDARRYTADNEVLIKVRGRPGVLAAVVRPRGASGPLPALLELSIDRSRNFAKEYAAHGYVGVAAYIERGRTSPFVPYQHDGDEARAVINWIAKQPWSDGRVAMVGEGYSGFTAWAAATRPPPALKAIATSAPTAPGIDVPMAGNIFQNSGYRWSLQVTNTDPALDDTFGDDALWRALNEKWYRSGRRYRDLGRIHGKPNPIFIRWLNHPSYDRFWQTMIPYREQFAAISIPVLTTTGYFDDSEPAALYYFSQHHRYNAHADHTLLMGPYDDSVIRHGALTSALLRDYEVDPAALIDLRELRYQWLDHVLKGAALPAQLSDRINYEVMGANEWQHAPSLEAMAVGMQKFYLDAAASGEGHRLTRRKNAKLAAIHQTIRFTDRTDAGWLPPTDLISKSLVTHDAVMFVSDPLSKPTQFSGLFSGHLDFTANKMDLDINIAMYELQAGGDYLRLFNPAYELRLSYAQDRAHRHLLKAGERQEVAFSSQRITSRQLDKGSRLVMVLRISKRPDREINYGTGGDVSEESIADGKVPLKVRWYNDSYLEIPIRAVAARAAPGAK